MISFYHPFRLALISLGVACAAPSAVCASVQFPEQPTFNLANALNEKVDGESKTQGGANPAPCRDPHTDEDPDVDRTMHLFQASNGTSSSSSSSSGNSSNGSGGAPCAASYAVDLEADEVSSWLLMWYTFQLPDPPDSELNRPPQFAIQ